MNNTITTISFSIFSNKGIYALLLGSGISKNSGIPTGWDIVVDLIKKLAVVNKEDCTPNPEEWFIKKYNQEPNYSSILSKLVKSSTERLNLLKPYFEPTDEELEQGLKQPTDTHKKIASLIKKGFIKVVITTNFDRLLEKALSIEGIEPIVIRHPDDIDGAMPLVHSNFILIKINGDYLDSRFLNTKEELSIYNKKIYDYVLRIVNEYGIISCGWSGKWDIALVNAIKKSENFRFYSYWTYLGHCEDELKEIAQFRKGQTLKIESSDVFFRELYENINALERINSNHPLSKDITVARLKKYIVKDEYKILLHDLIQEQLECSLMNLRVKDDFSLYPSKKNLLPIISHYIHSLEILLQLIINGVFWANKENSYLFILILESISEPFKFQQGSYYKETRDLFYFPSLIVLYCIGLSALKKDNYEIINACFNLKIRTYDSEYSDEIFLLEKVHPCIVEQKIMNEILSSNYLTPLSTYLHKTLEPLFVKHLYSVKDFQKKFDVFEYLISLNFLHLVGPKWGHDWAPWGEYQWRKNEYLRSESRIFTDFFKEAEVLKENWSPLKVGMFNSKYQVFEDTKTKLDNFLSEIYLH